VTAPLFSVLRSSVCVFRFGWLLAIMVRYLDNGHGFLLFRAFLHSARSSCPEVNDEQNVDSVGARFPVCCVLGSFVLVWFFCVCHVVCSEIVFLISVVSNFSLFDVRFDHLE